MLGKLLLAVILASALLTAFAVFAAPLLAPFAAVLGPWRDLALLTLLGFGGLLAYGAALLERSSFSAFASLDPDGPRSLLLHPDRLCPTIAAMPEVLMPHDAARLADAEAFVFDAYGTLFDVHSAVARHTDAVGPDAARLSELWRTKQLEYTWVLSLAGRYEPFWTLTQRALDHALACCPGVDPAVKPQLLDAYRTLDAYRRPRRC